tara:strand:- start:1297 stop:2595 length:1299 start_codon:yes stop_codon:yes gene_type:complete
MYLISVIIPVYNSEKFIDECFNSVKNKDNLIEIILVDDNSTDSTKRKLIEYSANNKNVKTVFHKNNLGVSETRNAGLKIASGKYIIFLDSDDFICENSFDQLLVKINLNFNVDIYIVNIVDDHLAYRDIYYCDAEDIYTNRNILNNISNLSHNLDIGVCWRYIIKRDILISNKIQFLPMARIYEDQEFFVKIFSLSKYFLYLDKFYYHHKNRKNSISQKIEDYCVTSCLHVLISLTIFFKENEFNDLNQKFILSRIKAMLIVLDQRILLCRKDELVNISKLFQQLINNLKGVPQFIQLHQQNQIFSIKDSQHLSIYYFHYLKQKNIKLIPSGSTNIFLYCAGIFGKGLAKILEDENYKIIGFIDDDKSIQGDKIFGYVIFSSTILNNYLIQNNNFHILICTQRKNICKIIIKRLIKLRITENHYSIAYSTFI